MIRVFAIVLAGHAKILSTWQPGAVLAMIDFETRSITVIFALHDCFRLRDRPGHDSEVIGPSGTSSTQN